MKTALAVACVAGISLVLTACGAPAESEPAPTVTSQQTSASPTPGLPIGAGDGNTAISFESIPASGVLEVTLGGPDGSASLELAPRMTVSDLDEDIVLVKNGTPVMLYPRSPGVTQGTLYKGSTPAGFLRVTVKASAGSAGTPDTATTGLPECDKRTGSAGDDALKDGVAAPFPKPTSNPPHPTYSLEQAKSRVDNIMKQVMMAFLRFYDTSVINGKPLIYTDQQFVDGINSWNSAVQNTIDSTNANDRAAVEAYVDKLRPTVENYPKVLTGS